jgi:glycosyltransferase involved in cell wall biosynthesis
MDNTLLNRTKCPVKLADMAYVGVPVVAEGVGQVMEYVKDGYTGVVCPVGEVEELGAAVVRLLQNPAEREPLSAAARVHIRASFTWDKTVETLEEVYL